MEKGKFLSILNKLQNICNQVNYEESYSDVIYEVLQFSKLANSWDSVYRIANFYNHNWLGNVDFMHIPDFYQTLHNCLNYPIIVARKKETGELVGISTIKYDENTDEHVDPYFPEKDAKYFSITGILTKKNNPHKGIGKKIYEIAIRGAYEFEKEYPGTQIMCVIDCRNRQSLNALASAVENIRKNNRIGEGKELPSHILGYYELRDTENKQLLEAPTLVMEVELQERKNSEKNDKMVIEFSNKEGENELLNQLLAELKNKFMTYGINPPIIEEDSECGIVYFYSLKDKEKSRLQNITIVPNDTEKGNERIPRDDEEISRIMGPIQSISVEEER